MASICSIIAEYLSRHNVSYLTARNDLERLTHAGLARKEKTGRESFYLPARDLEKRLKSSR